jgi:hypothetical protein
MQYAWIDPPLVSQRAVEDSQFWWRDHLGQFLGVVAEHGPTAVDEHAIGAADMVSLYLVGKGLFDAQDIVSGLLHCLHVLLACQMIPV